MPIGLNPDQLAWRTLYELTFRGTRPSSVNMDYRFDSSKPRLPSPPSSNGQPTRATDPDIKILTANARQFAVKRVVDPCSEQVARELGVTKRDAWKKANAALVEGWDSVTEIGGSSKSQMSSKRSSFSSSHHAR